MAVELLLALALCGYCVGAEEAIGNMTNDTAHAPMDPQSRSQSMQSATQRLFNTLLATFVAVFLGMACIRLKLVRPEDMKGMGFFTGKLAFPLLVFRTVATAQLASVDIGIIAACSLGKVVVLVTTWGATYCCYESHRPPGQRFLTATVFAFFVIASNDFALGFPVIQALYGQKLDMSIYITANALVGSFIFVPLIMVLFAIGENKAKAERGPATAAADSMSPDAAVPVQQARVLLAIMRDILLNPVIAMTLFGMLYQATLSFTLREEGNSRKLPYGVADVVDLITSPFGMAALFLTGTAMQSPRISAWASLLVLQKVVVCAFATYAFAGMLYDHSLPEDRQTILHNFSFLYGMIPASSAPLLFASQFDPGAAELVATAVLLGMVLAGPIMFATALFLERADILMGETLATVQLTVNRISIACGSIFIAILAILRKQWGFDCQGKCLVAAYGVTLLAYEVLTLAMNPRIAPELCKQYNQHHLTAYSVVLAWLQDAVRIMVLYLQVMFVYPKLAAVHTVKRGLLNVALCFALAMVPGILVPPNTVNEVCALVGEPKARSVWPNAIWTLVLLSATCALIIRATFRNKIERERDSQSPPESSSEDEDGSRSHGAPPSVDLDEAMNASAWTCYPPETIKTGLVGCQALRLFMQAINTAQVIAARSVMGSFAQMLVLESILEHGQLIILITLIFCDEAFGSHLAKQLPRLVPWLFARWQPDVRAGDVDPPQQGDSGMSSSQGPTLSSGSNARLSQAADVQALANLSMGMDVGALRSSFARDVGGLRRAATGLEVSGLSSRRTQQSYKEDERRSRASGASAAGGGPSPRSPRSPRPMQIQMASAV